LYEKSIVLPCVSKGILNYYAKKFKNIKHKLVYMPNSQSIMNYYNMLDNPSFDQFFSHSELKIKFVMLSGFFPVIRGIEYLIQVWENLNSKNATLDLYLSGLTTEAYSQLILLAPKTFNKSLFIKQPVSEDDILLTLCKYDVGIIPYLPKITLNHDYCSPNKFGQYLKSGLAVMSSDTKNISKIIHDNNLGFVYSTSDMNQAVKVFTNAIAQKNQLLKIKINSKEYFIREYNWENYSQVYEQYVENIA
jgi:glycosyltransferase involved in cell wall biosynthesis